MPPPFLEVSGHCLTCDSDVVFRSDREWLRDHLLCAACGSIPRERALMRVIEQYLLSQAIAGERYGWHRVADENRAGQIDTLEHFMVDIP